MFLVVIPLVVIVLEERWHLRLSMPPFVAIIGIIFLLISSALGIWSAYTMSVRGKGTPLPSAMPHKLVTGGPYQFVRNPMAVAGISQGIAVGMIASSWLVILYAVCGSLIWNWIIRPL